MRREGDEPRDEGEGDAQRGAGRHVEVGRRDGALKLGLEVLALERDGDRLPARAGKGHESVHARGGELA